MEKIKNIVYDTSYTNQIKKGGRINYLITEENIYSNIVSSEVQEKNTIKKKIQISQETKKK